MAIFKPAMDKTLPTLHGNCFCSKHMLRHLKILHWIASNKFWICYSRKRTSGMFRDRIENNVHL
jgi:hypothetical protein